MSRPDLVVAGSCVVLTGDWLRVAAQAVAIAQRARQRNGVPVSRAYELLGDALTAAVSDSGHSDVRIPQELRQLPHEQPTITVAQAAAWLGRSERQVRRTARSFNGRKIGGRWLLDEFTVRALITDKESTA